MPIRDSFSKQNIKTSHHYSSWGLQTYYRSSPFKNGLHFFRKGIGFLHIFAVLSLFFFSFRSGVQERTPKHSNSCISSFYSFFLLSSATEKRNVLMAHHGLSHALSLLSYLVISLYIPFLESWRPETDTKCQMCSYTHHTLFLFPVAKQNNCRCCLTPVENERKQQWYLPWHTYILKFYVHDWSS